MKKQYYPLHLKSHQADGWFTGYASVFDIIDQQNELVARGAFEKNLQTWRAKKKAPKFLWQHDPKKPIGIWHSLTEDAYGLHVEGQLLLDLQQGREAYALMKQGIIDGLSIGFTVVQSRKSYLTKTRVLEIIDLHEISLVTFAANPAARITQCKAVPQALINKIQALTQQIQEVNNKKRSEDERSIAISSCG